MQIQFRFRKLLQRFRIRNRLSKLNILWLKRECVDSLSSFWKHLVEQTKTGVFRQIDARTKRKSFYIHPLPPTHLSLFSKHWTNNRIKVHTKIQKVVQTHTNGYGDGLFTESSMIPTVHNFWFNGILVRQSFFPAQNGFVLGETETHTHTLTHTFIVTYNPHTGISIARQRVYWQVLNYKCVNKIILIIDIREKFCRRPHGAKCIWFERWFLI